MSVAPDQVRVPDAVSRRLGWTFVRCAVPFSTVGVIAGWLEGVRLSLPTPSLVDDWFAIAYARPAAHALFHGDYASAAVDFPGRYRPAYIAVWNYAQWHLFGDPSIATAAAWGVLRIALFLVAVWLLTAWLTGKRTTFRYPLLWLAPLAVAVTPATAVDLARHSPSEPLMVAGLIIGLALVGAGLRTLLVDSGPGRRASAITALVVGYPIYLFGVYSKETSIALLTFIPFFLKWLGPATRSRILESRKAKYLFGSSGLLIVAPLLHLGVHLASAVSGGADPYPDAHFSLGRRVIAAGILPLVGAPGPLETLLWLVGVPAAIAVTINMACKHERGAWLVAGVLSTGFLMSAFALALGETPSRYYIPWVVAVAAVVVQSLVRAKIGLQIAAVAIVLGVAFSGTQDVMAGWLRTERSGSTAVEMAKGVVRADCPLYLANFDVERRVAIGQLLKFGSATPVQRCVPGSKLAYALEWHEATLPVGFAHRCRSGWQQLEARNRVRLYRCQVFAGSHFLDQDEASSKPDVVIVQLRVTRHAPNPRNLFRSSSRLTG